MLLLLAYVHLPTVPPFSCHRFKLKTVVLSLLLGGLLSIALGVGGGWAQDPASPSWTSFGFDGDIAYGPVRLDGYELFSIAAALTEEDSTNVAVLQIRRNRIENRLKSQLQTLLDQDIDPNALQVISTTLNQQVAVQAVVEGKPNRLLLTVTALDTEIYGLTQAELGEFFAQRIQAGLLRGIAERQPEALWAQLKRAGVGGAIAAALLALLYQPEQWLQRSRQRLRQQVMTQQNTLSELQNTLSPDEPSPETITNLQKQLFRLKRQLEDRTWQKRILQTAMAGIGLVAFAWMLQRFPQTRSLGILLVKQPLGLLSLGLVIALVILASRLAIDWSLAKWFSSDATLSADQLDRRRRRTTTLSEVWKTIFTALWVALGVALAVSLLTLSSGWTLTLRLGVLGVLVSLAFQSAIKDALSGLLLLAKDAYVVGDLVTIQDLFGVVETMGLSITQIRSSPGSLVTLRNGEITTVSNHSRDWSRMDFCVWVDHDTDLNQALVVMRSVFDSLQASPDWATKLIDGPDILAVEQLDPQGISLRIRAQTRPGKQWSVTREYRLRLSEAFKANGIKLALPQREIRHRDTT
jgi:small conductance mechanosensitive channel